MELKLLIEQAPVPIAIFDAEMHYVAVSARWLGQLCLEGGILGCDVVETLPGSATVWREVRDHALAGRAHRAEAWLTAPACVRSWPWRDESGAIRGVVVLLESSAGPKPEGGGERADVARASANAFLDKAEHELRNPLATIGLSVERVAGDLESGRGDKEKDLAALRRAIRQAGHLVRLVDDMLQFWRVSIGAVELRRERIDLNDVVARAAQGQQKAAAQRNIGLTIELSPEPLLIAGDAARLAQVFGTILSNAVKVSEEGGRVLLTSRRDGPMAVVTVRDAGPGLTPEQVATIFDPYARRAQKAQKADGLGVGLAIARHFVTLHGGSLEARSGGPGQGSEFTVKAPLLPS
ncbi:MAG: ATP-binding protein [Methylocystis sp.]|uniref:sensor histidine kinase n=1 Tax=Methylocystis sp. TaxID=1911079 RepID=UPI003DA54E2F